MPIPTDTYWNIKRLNILFAVSAVILLAVTGWAIIQDYDQGWRKPQQSSKVWSAALVDEKIERDTTPEKEALLADLKAKQAELSKQFGPDVPQTQQYLGQLHAQQSDQAKMEFALNTLKAKVGVDESLLQDAITAKDDAAIARLKDKLAAPQAQVASDTEALAAKKDEVLKAQFELNAFTSPLDAVTKEITKLQTEVEGLKKKRDALEPRGLQANLSQFIRRAPLMQFINPAEKVQQTVLSDVRTSLGGLMEVGTIDRCITCHVNVANKDFTEPKVLAYLEEQVATSRDYRLPDAPPASSSAALATRAAPGAVAMPEFWHLWAGKIAPEIVRKPANLGRISTLAKTVGKPATVTINGKTLASFNYVPDSAKKEDAESAALDQQTRDQVVAELLKAWIGYGSKSAASPATSTGVQIVLPAGMDDKATLGPRTAAMKYVEELKATVPVALAPDAMKLVNDRYRRAMVAEANKARHKQGLTALDPSPAMLAHPRLDLYVDVDSKHSMEAVGCTSCHDGSGQETNFVLTAHTPRSIWVDQKTGEPVLPAQLDPKSAPEAHHGATLASMLTAVYPHDAIVPNKLNEIHIDLEGGHASPHATTNPAEIPEKNTVPAEPPVDTAPVTFVDPVTGQSGKAVSQMQYWKRTYEPGAPRDFDLVYHEWDTPMRPPKYLQANCVRCHNDVNDIKQEAPKVFEGRSLFVNMGCVNCHQMDSIPAETSPKDPTDVRLITANGQRKVGTDLRNITAKVSPAYINTWIWAPKAFRPSTKMPHFFMLENNSSDEELRRTRQEARAITEYLTRTANTYPQHDGAGQPVLAKSGEPVMGPLPTEYVIPASTKGSAEAGRAIFDSIGCQGCHTNLNNETGDKRDGKPITLGEKWIVNDLIKTGKVARALETESGKIPDAKGISTKANELFDHMTYNERQFYVTENFAPDYALTQTKYPDGTARPVFQHHGPELSGIGTKLTAGGRTPEQARAWLFDWVKHPRHYSEYTVMPQLRLSDQQALDLVEYLLDQKRAKFNPDDPWKAELTPVDTPKLIELTSLFLRSRYSAQTATAKADDDTELTALAADALTTAQVTIDAAKTQAKGLSKDEKRLVFLGKKLISNYGCMSCHAINGAENLSSPCANLSDWGQKGIDKLDFGYLDHHKLSTLKADEKTGEPVPRDIPMVNGVSAKASSLVGAEWRANFAENKVAEPVTVGWPHVDHSRTSWLTQKLKNTRAYDRGKVLLDPDPSKNDAGKPYDKLKMPTFYLNDTEVDSIVTWVISNRDRLISHKLLSQAKNPRAEQIARGRQLAQKYNCVGCHSIEQNTPSVQQYYKPDDITTKAPPSLRGEGNKVQHTWLFNFLKHVEPLRPLLYMTPETKPGIRMPSFPILDQEATDIAAYFAATSNREADALAKQLLIVQKYIETQQIRAAKPIPAVKNPTTLPATAAKDWADALIVHAGAMIAAHDNKAALESLQQADAIATAAKLTEPSGATTKPVSARLKDAIDALNDNRIPDAIPWPGDDWYINPLFGTQTQFLRDWALANKQVNDLQLDPTKNKPAELAKNHRMILFKAAFVQDLYNAPYPFVETPRPDVADAQFKKGEAFFYEMQCLKCHVLGDPNVAGAQKNPTAPNLALASRRLQRRWVRRWTQEPPIIQVGTAMPPFFTGLPVFDVHGQPWPRSQGAPPAECKRVEAIYGNNVEEQTGLLLDFLFAAGVRGYTGIQPAAGAAPAGTAAPAPKAAEAPKVEAPKVEAPKVEAPKPAPVKAPEPKASPKAEPAKPQAAAGNVSVKGTVLLDGKAPEMPEINMSAVKECAVQHADPVTEETIVANDKGGLKNVVITVTGGLPQQSYDPPPEPAVLDQQGCMYHPHVLPVMVGQKILVRNSDSFLHNVHSLSVSNPSFNVGQPTPDPGKAIDPLKEAETFRVKCDVHSWMSAYIVAVDNPFFAVTADDGSFSIANLPPGEYKLTAWQEQLGTKEATVKVEAGKPAEVQFKFAAP